MRQKLITLDPTSWDLAAKKPNFSQWVRDQLRSERNRRPEKHTLEWIECVFQCGRARITNYSTCNYCMSRIDTGEEE